MYLLGLGIILLLLKWQGIGMVADWVSSGGASLGKPTHFETTDGSY